LQHNAYADIHQLKLVSLAIALLPAPCHNCNYYRRMTIFTRQTILIAAALVWLGEPQTHATASVDFATQIEPIFKSSCLKCHGPEKQKGDLRLDSKAAAFKGGKDAIAISPGHADKSDLYRRIILPAGSDDVMPSKGDPLTKNQTDLIRDWINQGATWPDGLVAAVADTQPASNSYENLPAFKPSPSELAAVAKLQAAGISIHPIAANTAWSEANFRNQAANITDASLAPLKDIASLVDLNLAGTKITDAGLQNLAGLTNLVHLHLEHTGVTDAGLAQLKNLSHLEYLNLYATSVSDAGIVELKDLHSLRHLYIWQTKVTAQGAADLQKELPDLLISRGWEDEPAAQQAQAKPSENSETKK
jgi:mono/diheme cytochrome c family protein